MGFMKLEEGNDAISSPFKTLSNTRGIQQNLNSYGVDLPKFHDDTPDETLSGVVINPQKRMMSKSRLNHLFRDRRGFFKGQRSFGKRYKKDGTFPRWVRLWILDHMTRKNDDSEMANEF